MSRAVSRAGGVARVVLRVLKGVAALLLALVVLALAVPLCVPLPPLEGTSPAAALAGPASRFARVDGLDLHYEEAGAGDPTFLLLHGFLASTFTWREVQAPLAAIGRTIAFDRPAFGLSARPLPGDPGWPAGASPYAAAAQVEQTIHLMDALGVERAVLVGNSAGGTLALRIALAHPERVRALVLLDPAVYTDGPPPWTRWLLDTPQLRRVGPLLLRGLADQSQRMVDAAWHDPSRVDAATWTGYRRWLGVDGWDQALWHFTLAARDHADVREGLAAIRAPTLVITGDDDRVIPTAESVRLAEAIADAELVVIGACGHVPQEECPEPVLAAIRGFVARLPP